MDSRIELVLKHKEDEMASFYTIADRLATLATTALTATIIFRNNTAYPNAQSWMLKASWVGFIGTIVGFLLINCGKIEFHRDATVAIMKPDKESALFGFLGFRSYFHAGRYLLVAGFIAGILFLTLYGWKH